MEEKKNEIVLFENQGVKLEVNVKDETVWLNLEQMAELFKRDKSVISRHIKNALTEELKDEQVVAKFATTTSDGKILFIILFYYGIIVVSNSKLCGGFCMIPINRRMEELRAIEILKKSEYAVLSTSSKDNIPYGVAINYFYVEEENCLYFHTKKVGTKIDNIKTNPNVSLFILGNQKVIPDRYITHYESVVVTGKASIILDEDEIREKLILLCDKLAPNETKRRKEVIEKYLKAVCIGKIIIENITGKKNEDY